MPAHRRRGDSSFELGERNGEDKQTNPRTECNLQAALVDVRDSDAIEDDMTSTTGRPPVSLSLRATHIDTTNTLINGKQYFPVPPTIRVVPQNRQITARKGSTVTLECKASGNPVPAIYWHKKDAFTGASHLSESPTLLLERVDRHHAGIYQCTADNGVREAVHVDIEVTVLSTETSNRSRHGRGEMTQILNEMRE
ncbi:hypothetical protein AND_000112 [Anopheles darlingi]|uniref:Ig-like domain-containing protein n=1 Tax=Anopheles darlingi TaxID=43151 RepID=W5JX48_ANODA|nr:hypothetical protein AND_000112 [Anopheles darlingi]